MIGERFGVTVHQCLEAGCGSKDQLGSDLAVAAFLLQFGQLSYVFGIICAGYQCFQE